MFRRPLLPGFIWTIIIVLLTLSPGKFIPKITSFHDWLGPDKLIHLLLFGIFAYLLLAGFSKLSGASYLRKNAVFISLLLGMVFAFFTEVMQKFVIPGRNGNIYDFLADMLGLLVGYMIWYIIGRNDKKKLFTSKKYN